MNSFEGIVEFIAVAESQTFSAAAKRLGCSTSNVSRQVSRLEERLGCALLARTTRMVSLTQAGTVYYQQCKDLMTGLQQANEEVGLRQYQLCGTLRVSTAGTFAEEFVVPALIDFAGQHPELTIEIDVNSRIVNFVEEGIDFAIRYGQLKNSGLVARKLVNRPMMAVASPAYLEKFGTPQTPAQLIDHSCLVSNNDYWNFDHEGVANSIKVQGRMRCNNASAIIKAMRTWPRHCVPAAR